MVLEQLYAIEWLEKKARYAFIMGFAYAVLGMTSALFLFPEDPGLVAVAFTSLLILPSLQKLLAMEENKEANEQGFNLWIILEDHWDIFKIYTFIFLGVLLAFGIFTVALPNVAASRLFNDQLAVLGLTGQAIGSFSGFSAIFMNNLKVLIFCLLASFIYGSGAVFIITWNASVWGAVFGAVAKNAAEASNPFFQFFLTIAAVFPHMITEAGSYILAAISGGVVSKAVIREKPFSPVFTRILQDALIIFGLSLIVLVAAGYIEVFITKHLMKLFGV